MVSQRAKKFPYISSHVHNIPQADACGNVGEAELCITITVVDIIHRPVVFFFTLNN
jgi:hypothetical protein